jgi:hypothetical protein
MLPDPFIRGWRRESIRKAKNRSPGFRGHYTDHVSLPAYDGVPGTPHLTRAVAWRHRHGLGGYMVQRYILLCQNLQSAVSNWPVAHTSTAMRNRLILAKHR